MMVLDVEILSEKALDDLRRLARRNKKKEREWAAKLGPHCLLEADLSSWKMTVLQREDEKEQSALRGLPSIPCHFYEDPEGVKLLFLASNAGEPVLANFSSAPSKNFEMRLRQSAKVRGLLLRFYRLTSNHVAVQLSRRPAAISPQQGRHLESLTEWDRDFLRRLRIKS